MGEEGKQNSNMLDLEEGVEERNRETLVVVKCCKTLKVQGITKREMCSGAGNERRRAPRCG